MKAKLSIKINNKKPLELNELASSLNSFSKEYDVFCKNVLKMSKNDRRLEIVELKKGSLLIDLVSNIPTLITQANSIYQFGENFIQRLNYFKKDKKEDKVDLSKQSCYNTQNFLNPTSNDNSKGSIIIINQGSNSVANITQPESKEIQDNIEEYANEKFGKEEMTKYEKVPFYWDTTSFSKKNIKADKGIVEKFDTDNAYKIIFENPNDKLNITKNNPSFKKDWQYLTYIVDSEVIKREGRIIAYKIFKIYLEDTIEEI